MNWKGFEDKVCLEMQKHYPDLNIESNVKLPGRFSGTTRQIDVYITGIIAGSYYQKVIDTKYYNKLIDVKVVEEFIGMLNDLDCTSGMLITNKGFTKSAIQRAINNPNYLDIDILSFNEIKLTKEAKTVIGYSESTAIYVTAPLGWTADLNVENQPYRVFLHSLRYSNKEEASENRECINCMDVPKSHYKNIMELSEEQVEIQKKVRPVKINHSYSSWRINDKKIFTIRTIYIEGSTAIETTAFFETKKNIYYAVLVSPLVFMKTNFPKLIYTIDSIVVLEKEE